MRVSDTKFKGLKIISHKKNSDSRGILREIFKKKIIKWDNLIFDYDRHPMERRQGPVIIFPSNLYHEIKPITKGKRYSLVQWFKGNKRRQV